MTAEKLDRWRRGRWLLVHHPELWVMRLHLLVPVSVGLSLFALCLATLRPLDPADLPDLTVHFSGLALLSAGVACLWGHRAARDAQDLKPATGLRRYGVLLAYAACLAGIFAPSAAYLASVGTRVGSLAAKDHVDEVWFRTQRGGDPCRRLDVEGPRAFTISASLRPKPDIVRCVRDLGWPTLAGCEQDPTCAERLVDQLVARESAKTSKLPPLLERLKNNVTLVGYAHLLPELGVMTAAVVGLWLAILIIAREIGWRALLRKAGAMALFVGVVWVVLGGVINASSRTTAYTALAIYGLIGALTLVARLRNSGVLLNWSAVWVGLGAPFVITCLAEATNPQYFSGEGGAYRLVASSCLTYLILFPFFHHMLVRVRLWPQA